MKKLLCLVLLLMISSIGWADVLEVMPDQHKFAPMDQTRPFVELFLRTEARHSEQVNQGRQDVGLIGNVDTTLLGQGANDEVKRYQISIDLYTNAQDDNSGLITGEEKLAIRLFKDYGQTAIAENPSGIDANDARFNTAYSADRIADTSDAYSYLRVGKILINYKDYSPAEQVIEVMNETYTSGIESGPQTYMIYGKNYSPANDNTMDTDVIAQTGTAVHLAVYLPKAFRFDGIWNKFGIRFLGLNCPDDMRIKFWRAADPAQQIEDMNPADYVELPNLTTHLDVTDLFGGMIWQYGTTGMDVSDAIGSDANGGATTPEQLSWGYCYRLEYHFPGEANWFHGVTHEIDSSNTGTNHGGIEFYFSPNQGRFSGVGPTYP